VRRSELHDAVGPWALAGPYDSTAVQRRRRVRRQDQRRVNTDSRAAVYRPRVRRWAFPLVDAPMRLWQLPLSTASEASRKGPAGRSFGGTAKQGRYAALWSRQESGVDAVRAAQRGFCLSVRPGAADLFRIAWNTVRNEFEHSRPWPSRVPRLMVSRTGIHGRAWPFIVQGAGFLLACVVRHMFDVQVRWRER